MRKRKFLVFFICLILIGSLIAACGQVQEPRNQNNNRNNTEGEQTRVVPRTTSPRRMVPSPMPGDNNGANMNNNLDNNTNNDNINNGNNNMGDNEDYTERVEDIARRAAQLKEIESAACVITGDTALVGVQFDDQYKGGITNQIKDKVEDACRKEDPEIQQVVVTADPDAFSRIQDMLQDIGEGRPISGFAEEINELINRIQPK